MQSMITIKTIINRRNKCWLSFWSLYLIMKITQQIIGFKTLSYWITFDISLGLVNELRKEHFYLICRKDGISSLEDLDSQAAEYIKNYMDKTVRNINKQSRTNEKELINVQRRRYFLTVSGVTSYIVAFALGVSVMAYVSVYITIYLICSSLKYAFR